MVAFASLDASGWGIGIPNLVPPSLQLPTPFVLPTSLTGYSLTMAYRTQEDGTDIERNVRVELGKEITTQFSLVGRRTTVYEVSTTPNISSVPLILKMSMQPIGRTPEYDFLNDATAKGVQHLPKVLMWTEKKTEWRLSNGAWGKLFPDNEGDKDYKDRCQRMIVFPKYTPIKNVICAANMHTIFMQLIDCLDSLRHEAKILHRDISLNNLMCEYRGESLWLILNDFDLAARVGNEGLSIDDDPSGNNVGTLPFMAVDMLKETTDVGHYLWHDLESVFWVALWCLVKYPRSGNIADENARRKALLDWEKGGLNAIRQRKEVLINARALNALLLTPEMRPYKTWILLFWEMFYSACLAENEITEQRIFAKLFNNRKEDASLTLDWETLNGAVTCDKIRERLSAWEAKCSGEIEGYIPYSSGP